VLGWPKRCKLAHAFLSEYSYKGFEVGPTSGPTWRLSHLQGHELGQGLPFRQVSAVLEEFFGLPLEEQYVHLGRAWWAIKYTRRLVVGGKVIRCYYSSHVFNNSYDRMYI
jgi:hypothetical protein